MYSVNGFLSERVSTVNSSYKRKIFSFLVGNILFFAAASAVLAETNDEKIEKMCQEGNSFACFTIGEKKRTLDKDNNKALEYYAKACDLGWITSCNNAGILTQMKGAQYSKQWKEAAKFFQKACDEDESNACFNLGSLKYREGRASSAKKYYKKACDLGNGMACENIKVLEN